MLMLIATAPVMLAFAIVNYKQTVFSVVTFFVVVANDFYIVWFYLAYMYTDWKRFEGIDEPQRTEPDPKKIPPVAVNGVYTSVTPGVKLDKVRLFNRALIDMRNSNLDVNMTETFWAVEKINDEIRWNRTGGAGRSDFVEVLERGISFGAYKKVGGQGKRVPADWRLIRKLEQGTPLP